MGISLYLHVILVRNIACFYMVLVSPLLCSLAFRFYVWNVCSPKGVEFIGFGVFCSEETSQESKLEFSEDEETLIIRMFNLVGERFVCFPFVFLFSVTLLAFRFKISNTQVVIILNTRWSLIAGRIPGRTAEEIEKYWNTRCSTSEWRRSLSFLTLPLLKRVVLLSFMSRRWRVKLVL